MTLSEQRRLNAYQLGRLDFEEHKRRFAPAYFNAEEREFYDAGYLRAQRDLLSSWAGKNGGSL